MSAIALKWAYSQKVGNSTAKNILGFLASHNFPGDTLVFKVKTIMNATEYSETAVKDGLKLLHMKGLVIKEARYDSNGKQQANEYRLNIPKEYVEKFMEDYYDLPTGGGRLAPGGGSAGAPLGGRQTPPLNNNIYNNNLNKSGDSSNDKKINKEKTNFANVESQSNSYNEENTNKVYPISGLLADYLKKQGSTE